MERMRCLLPIVLVLVAALVVGCGGGAEESPRPGASGPPGAAGARRPGGPGGSGPTAAVPIEVAPVERRNISSYIETNGTLEAENEVDLVARVSGPIISLEVEEGMMVQAGQVLARIDDREIRARVDISQVALEEAKLAYERAKTLRESQLLSPEEYEQADTRLETARAQYEADTIQLGYTTIKAPFAGLIVARYIDLAEQVDPGSRLFRLSDFTPLLCPIQVPERDLPKLRLGQHAYLTFEAWPDERFDATVLRIRPVVDAATGTVRVTLDVEGRGRLRPGMFARVYVETETREDTLVIPKAALSLESLGDTVYVAQGEVASRRPVQLGFREGDFVEVLDGVEVGENVIVVGQDGLSDGTPVSILAGQAAETPNPQSSTGAGGDAKVEERGEG